MMTRFNPIHSGPTVLSILAAFAITGAAIRPMFASDGANNAEESPAKNLDRMNGGIRIDCITPDGQLIAMPGSGENNLTTSTLVLDDDTLRYPLQEGETVFVISFLKTSLLDRFTFVNENAGVQGDMRIAVSNCRLPADSPKWTEVSGKTEFTSRRLFNLSMVGVEAHFVKLSFHVEKGSQLASLSRLKRLLKHWSGSRVEAEGRMARSE